MSEPVQPETRMPISVVTALSDAFTYIIQGFVPFFRLSWKYFAFVCVAGAALFAAVHWLVRNENETAVYVLSGSGLILGFLVSVAYYVVIVRNWLLAEEHPAVLRVYPKFLLRTVLLTLMLVVVAAAVILPAFVGGIALFDYFIEETDEPSTALVIGGIIGLIVLGLIAVALVIYLAGRLITWFVAAAVQSPLTAAGAWRSTKGAGFRIMGGMIVLALAFGIVDITIETSLGPLLGITSDSFDLFFKGEKLIPLFVLFLLKMLVYFPQVAASMVFCGSLYRQTSGR